MHRPGLFQREELGADKRRLVQRVMVRRRRARHVQRHRPLRLMGLMMARLVTRVVTRLTSRDVLGIIARVTELRGALLLQLGDMRLELLQVLRGRLWQPAQLLMKRVQVLRYLLMTQLLMLLLIMVLLLLWRLLHLGLLRLFFFFFA